VIEICADVDAAVRDVPDGATVLIGGFGRAGMPFALIDGLLRQGARDLTVVNDNAGNGDTGLAALLAAGQVRKVICSFPRQSDSYVFDELYRAGKVELELVPQGTLAERIRAGGAGIGGFYTRTGVGTKVAEGKETRVIGGREYLLELPLRADFALVKAWKADAWGNLLFRRTARNFNPVMCGAAKVTIAEVEEIVPVGSLSPDAIHVPSIYVQRLVQGKDYQKPIERRTLRMR
jgi:3-oxoadipate CoA-transferase alpha subunit